MRRRKHRNLAAKSTINTPETAYARGRTAQWLTRLVEQGVALDDSFFECFGWAIGGLQHPLQLLTEEIKKLPAKAAVKAAAKSVRSALDGSTHHLDNAFEAIVEEHPVLHGAIYEIVMQECAAAAKKCDKNSNVFTLAQNKLAHTFGLSKDACALCEFVFIKETFYRVESYIEDHLEINKYGNRKIFATMLNIPSTLLRKHLNELSDSGLLDLDGCFSLRDSLKSFWDEANTQQNKMFCQKLTGEALPLERFKIPQEDIAHVRALLTAPGDSPVHILFYGPPGTGKTTLARSLAADLNIKAWAVSSRDGDDDKDRRASLTASLHIAAKHDGAFVLVDEAERMLDTTNIFSEATKDKAWLNDFLEQPGRRIIWITNHISHVEQAVRRRFTYSIHFDDLGKQERKAIWRQVLASQRVATYLSDQHIETLTDTYDVPASVIEKSVTQAKQLKCGKKGFYATVERVLRAHVTLRCNGAKPRVKPQASADYTLEGVCMEGSAQDLLNTCRRIDERLRSNKHLNPGDGTMLFYGPPGTGKTALARYIAKELDRECIVKKASDLLDMYVGKTEQHIAAAFQEAEKEGAVLVIDEADSFIYSRDIAQQSWETTQVNEFLTWLE
jgi:AAA+ superfamily predicted ATPase